MWKDISQSLLMKNKSSFPLTSLVLVLLSLHLSITSKWKYGHLEETLPYVCTLYPLLFCKSSCHLLRVYSWPDADSFFLKGRGTRDQIANVHWIIEKAREFQKNIYFCFIKSKPLIVWITINCGKFWRRWEYQTTWPASWETYMQVRKQQLGLDTEQQTGSK